MAHVIWNLCTFASNFPQDITLWPFITWEVDQRQGGTFAWSWGLQQLPKYIVLLVHLLPYQPAFLLKYNQSLHIPLFLESLYIIWTLVVQESIYIEKRSWQTEWKCSGIEWPQRNGLRYFKASFVTLAEISRKKVKQQQQQPQQKQNREK